MKALRPFVLAALALCMVGGHGSAEEPVRWKALPRGGARPELVLQVGHTSPYTMIVNACMSLDGRRLATTSAGDDTVLWDVQTGRMLSSFGDHRLGTGLQKGIAFSPDGRLLVKGGGLWDTVSGVRISTFAPACISAAFSPDGQRVLAGTFMSAILWDVASGKKVREFAFGEGEIRDDAFTGSAADAISSVAYSPDGRQMLTADGRGTATLWDATSGERIRSFHVPVEGPGRGWACRRAVFHPRGHEIATALGQTVVLWDAETGRRIRDFERDLQEGAIYNLAFSHDGRLLAGGSHSEKVFLWDVSTGEVIRIFGQQDGRICWLAFDSEDRRLMTANVYTDPITESKICFWDVASGSLVRDLPLFPFEIAPAYVERHPVDDTFLLNTFKGWNPPTAQVMQLRPIEEPRGFGGRYGRYRYTADGRGLVATVDDGQVVDDDWVRDWKIALWDRETGERLRTFPGNSPFALSPDGRWLLALEPRAPFRIILFNLNTGAEVRRFTPVIGDHPEWYFDIFGDIVFSADSKSVFAGCRSGVIFQWDLATGLEVRRFGRPLEDEETRLSGGESPTVLPGPNGRWLLAHGRFSGTNLWDARTGALVARIPNAGRVAAFDPDGRRIAFGTADGVDLWDVAHQRTVASMHGHEQAANSVAFDKKGERILSGSRDGTAILWNAASGRALARLVLGNAGQDWLVITPHGFYQGTDRAEANVSWRIGGEVFPVELYENRFRRPDLVGKALRGEKILEKDVVPGAHKPPSLTIKVEKSEARHVTFEAQAEPGSEGTRIASIRVFLDGRDLATPVEREDKGTGQTVFRGKVDFPPGKTRAVVAAVVTDAYGLKSLPAAMTIVRPGPATPVERTLYVLAVGVSRHKTASMNLPFAHADALALGEVFKRQEGRAFQKVATRVLTNEQATTAGIRESLLWLQQCQPKDMAVVSFSGHGARDREGRLFYVPHDDDTGFFPWNDVASGLRQVRAGSVLFLSDCCHAGAFGKHASQDELAHALLREARVMVFAASRGLEVSWELGALKHGAFTYAILEGLEGKADLIRDGRVTVSELQTYVANRVKQLTNDRQHPHIPRMNDFDPEAVIAHVD